jgi:hypothetical protein
VTVGATRQWNWQKQNSFGIASGYSEIAVGRWVSHDEAGSTHSTTQIGITPVLRLQTGAGSGLWFVELGVGANVITPLYRTSSKRFSTAFNFGDHFGVGRQFGPDRKQEIALRLQHFSNGSIKAPNPGENFLQLRYSGRF